MALIFKHYNAIFRYGTAMVESLPEKEFDFLLEEHTATFDFMSVPDDGPLGYILEVDLEYPKELHDAHSDYPLFPESVAISLADLSPYTMSLANTPCIIPSSCQKLLRTWRKRSFIAI